MTSTPHSGNPTPVFILDDSLPWPPDTVLQTLSSEMNQAEQSFVRRESTADGKTYRVRWFTPVTEERFCGHGVVGTALALAEHTRRTSFTLKIQIGTTISIEVSPPSSISPTASVTMKFPEDPVVPGSVASGTKRAFVDALGIREDEILAIAENNIKDIVIELPANRDFSAQAMNIDPKLLLQASPPGTRSQIVTSGSRGDGAADFVKRVFAFGGEDQATGSTYASLAPYWGTKLGKERLIAQQVSSRGGGAEIIWDAEERSVSVVAKGVKVGQGEFYVPINMIGAAGSRERAKL